MRSPKIFPLLPLLALLVCALPSCTAGLRMRAQQAERSGAYYEAERLYKELYTAVMLPKRPTEGDAIP